MYVLSVGIDRNIFDAHSAVQKRTLLYGSFYQKMKVVVFTRKNMGFQRMYIGEHIEVIPTNSHSRFLYVYDAVRIIAKLFSEESDKDAYQKVITCQDPFETGLVGWFIAKKYNIPLHIQIHTDIGSQYFRTQNILNRIRMHIAKRVISRAYAFRVVSARIADTLISRYGVSADRITILPIRNEFNPHRRVGGDTPYILVVSRLEAEKRVVDAMRVFALVVKSFPNFVLKIVGDGSQKKMLMQYARKLGLEHRVEFLGYIKDIAPLYAHAHVLLHTALYEGFGLVLYEAGCAGCPIVSTDVGIAQDMQKNGYPIVVVPVDEVLQSAMCIQKFLHSFESGVLGDTLHMIDDEKAYRDAYVASLMQAMGT